MTSLLGLVTASAVCTREMLLLSVLYFIYLFSVDFGFRNEVYPRFPLKVNDTDLIDFLLVFKIFCRPFCLTGNSRCSQ